MMIDVFRRPFIMFNLYPAYVLSGSETSKPVIVGLRPDNPAVGFSDVSKESSSLSTRFGVTGFICWFQLNPRLRFMAARPPTFLCVAKENEVSAKLKVGKRKATAVAGSAYRRTPLTPQDFGSRLELAAWSGSNRRAFRSAKILLCSAAPAGGLVSLQVSESFKNEGYRPSESICFQTAFDSNTPIYLMLFCLFPKHLPPQFAHAVVVGA